MRTASSPSSLRARNPCRGQLGFDTTFHESDGHQYGGLRPLLKALLPGKMEAWHYHANVVHFDEAPVHQEKHSGPLLKGPLADGEGPKEWLEELESARAAINA